MKLRATFIFTVYNSIYNSIGLLVLPEERRMVLQEERRMVLQEERRMDDIRVERRLEGRGEELLLLCPVEPGDQVSNTLWKCRGCFGSSQFKEISVATQEGILKNPLFIQSRFQVVREQSSYNLKIQGVESIDSGEYFCLVNNSTVPRLRYNLAVQDVTSPPGQPLIMAFDSRSVLLSWIPPSNLNFAPVNHYIVQIKQGESLEWTEFNSVSTQNAEPDYKVENLIPFTVYSFRISAVNRIGISDPSPPSYFMMTGRELPTGKPKIEVASSLTYHSIFVSWSPPPQELINGEFMGYRVSWKPRNGISLNQTELRDYSQTQITLVSLLPDTYYLIFIQVLNLVGVGPSATAVIKTLKQVPGPPVNISISNIHDTGFSISWSAAEPEKDLDLGPVDDVQGYRVYYTGGGFSRVDTVVSTLTFTIHNILALVPYTVYSVHVRGYNKRGESRPSIVMQVLTDVSGPGSPVITNVSCESESSLRLFWRKPKRYQRSVDVYKIFYKPRESVEGWNLYELSFLNFTTDVSALQELQVSLHNLSEFTEYTLLVQGYSRSLYRVETLYPGLASEPLHVVTGKSCTGVQVAPIQEEEEENSGSTLLTACILGTILAISIFIVLSIALAFRKGNRASRGDSSGSNPKSGAGSTPKHGVYDKTWRRQPNLKRSGSMLSSETLEQLQSLQPSQSPDGPHVYQVQSPQSIRLAQYPRGDYHQYLEYKEQFYNQDNVDDRPESVCSNEFMIIPLHFSATKESHLCSPVTPVSPPGPLDHRDLV